MTEERFCLLELFPSPYPRHRLNDDNHFRAFWPFTNSSHVDEPMRLKPGFKWVGWAYPPYDGGAEQCMVVELTEPLMDSYTPDRVEAEPGIYWYHWGNTQKVFAKPV